MEVEVGMSIKHEIGSGSHERPETQGYAPGEW